VKILLCGGGTGGHIVPILAIAHELKLHDSTIDIVYVGEHGGKFSHLTKDLTSINSIETVFAGKIRRYHNEPWLDRILDIKSFIQCLFLIKKTKPDIIFLKGGFVGLPLGLAAALLQKPFITHDSDSISSLTNKIVSKWAVYNATGMQKDLYTYPSYKTEFVGVPVGSEYVYITETLKNKYRNDLKIPENAKFILITGGSLGARRLNKYVVNIIDELFEEIDNLYVVHQVGKNNKYIYKNIAKPSLIVVEFINDLYKYSGAADIVLTRSGANTVAELAVQGKPMVIVPNPELTGGHQTKNANVLLEKKAAVVLTEKELDSKPRILLEQLVDLLKNKIKCKDLSINVHKESVPDSANKIAMLLLSLVENNKN
jgi:UDP-N-acetylglucosamine--N-acetylmuramyl-(pentapeptide) pyrophosphoryl-undecaprenol N-acetylglucosamine transferase